MSNVSVLAIIPARGGSKRVPRKNARILGEQPLITWSIATALASDELCNVLLTTDDQEIAEIGRDAGALVPWLRPKELASDTADTLDVLQHALAWYEIEFGLVDAVVLLQPTCPFRRAASVPGAIKLFFAQPGGEDRHSVVSVSPSSVPPEWCFRMDAAGRALHPIMGWPELGKRSQDLEPAFQLNGSIYVASGNTIRAGRPLVAPGTLAFLMNGAEEAIDIDTEEDWHLAESFLKR